MKPASEMHLETALLPASRGLFASLRERLAKRPDTEHQAALIRVAFAILVSCYLIIALQLGTVVDIDRGHAFEVMAFIIPYSILMLLAIIVWPQISIPRRIVAIIFDIGAVTYAIYFLGEAGIPFFGLYLFNACGNGFRFGPRYLYLSSALSILGFTFALITSEYWASQRTLGVGILLVLVVIPMYFASLTSQLHTVLRHMHKIATHDNLTGLPNRHSFYEHLQQILRSAEKDRTRFAVVFIDLDGFKPINDALGHAAGDEVLRSVASRLKQCVRHDDVVARIGGDEFVIILSGIEMTPLLSVVHKVIDMIAAPYTGTAKTVTLTSSVGVATYPDHGHTVDELVAHADAAMYRSKRAGRNYLCLNGELQTANISSTHASEDRA
jgi:diguanylate cyclase (GGDEF)-like protein